jgi:hypothetical protein
MPDCLVTSGLERDLKVFDILALAGEKYRDKSGKSGSTGDKDFLGFVILTPLPITALIASSSPSLQRFTKMEICIPDSYRAIFFGDGDLHRRNNPAGCTYIYLNYVIT